MKLLFKLTVICLVLQVLSGCWDVKEIEKLSFARGLAIDETSDHQYKLTYQNLLPQSEDSQTAGKPKFVNVTARGNTMLEAVSEIALQDPPVYSDHLKVLIFGEKLMSHQNINNFINHFIRDDELRRSSYIFIAKGKAADILTESTPTQQQVMPAEKLIDITNHGGYNGKIMMPLRIGRASIYCQNGYSFLIQAVTNKGKKAVYDGAGILKSGENKLIGFISPYETQTLNWLIGTIQGGVLPAEEKGYPITFEIKRSKSKIKPAVKNGKLSFHVSVFTKGLMTENQNPKENSFNERYLKEVERIFEKKLEADMKNAMYKLQHTYRTDPVFFSDYVRINFPDYWNKVKNDWDEVFAEADFHYDISLKIVNFGTAGK
ncbi:Ger(x)C family spore germination protein [Bacillus atrophaeus]|uniref:Ger(x)C family spore germination protein n=1 Tax=Bacillus atrophaeus TaxID=1452 RepID=UPI0007C49250|nr:Ger(x)C family spore germination protein [Bacillus atrophaeus]PRS08640.1 Ger(x)C family spore germination protein [Bacillus atrophaeus]QUF64944.1 Ger(x)C family spore germination protein [Bacillus atrophaeus]WFE16240.1 Ger(x)C family spore germination protein [Bacillus atrophaeus]